MYRLPGSRPSATVKREIDSVNRTRRSLFPTIPPEENPPELRETEDEKEEEFYWRGKIVTVWRNKRTKKFTKNPFRISKRSPWTR